jgi:hypothetical protein
MEGNDLARSIGGYHLDGRDVPPVTYKRGRRCCEPGCEAVLSIYNPGPCCAQHAPRRLLRTVGRKAS